MQYINQYIIELAQMNLNLKRKQQSIKSYVRIKPVISNEQKLVECRSQNTVLVNGQTKQQYNFDKVFDQNSSNQEVFQVIGDPLISHSIEGFNACVLAYGQTASGKTFTMKGNRQSDGMIPLTIQRLFSKINSKDLIAQVTISYLEIYNENIIDLLSSADGYMEMREDYKKNITLVGLNEIKVTSVEDSMKYFQQGQSRRKVASNTLNMASSRSHTIFRITLSVIHKDFSQCTSYINMVDLAGSEGVSRTKAEGNTRKEGENINKSILALSNVIRGMSAKQNYVNFRDSKLTRILQSSLCSNSLSIVICTVNPTASNLQQSVNTIKFGIEASNIKLSLKQNMSLSNKKSQTVLQSENRSQNFGELLAHQRVEYQQNKRVITHLRQENRQLRQIKRKSDEKIQFLQLQIHRYEGTVKHYEEELQRYQRVSFKKQIDVQERQMFENKIQELKSEKNVMADKYDILNEEISKLEKNQRYLLNRITKYENQIDQLKKQTSAEESINRPKTPIKMKNTGHTIRRQQEYCPLTIGSIVLLKTQIIKLKQQLYHCHEDFGKLVEQRNELCDKIQKLQKSDEQDFKATGKLNCSHFEQKQIKYLLRKIKKLKNQISMGKNRQKKLIKHLKGYSQKGIEDFDQFNEWLANRKQLTSARKSQRKSPNQF